MKPPRSALLLIGSPKTQGSTSGYLGAYLMERLEENNVKTNQLHLHSCLQSAQKRHELLDAIRRTDLIVISVPLYVDSLPAMVIRALEFITENCPKQDLENTGIAVIINCGFPENRHNDTAVAIYRQFARQTNLHWLGCLAMGMGGRINQQLLNPQKRIFKNIKQALDIAAETLACSQDISEQAVRLMGRSTMPNCLYLWIVDMVWKKKANKNMVRHKLGYRPYQKYENGRNDFMVGLI